MYLADTKVIIDSIKYKKYDRFYICEASLFEILKNKPDSERRRQFKNVINYCKKTSSNFLLSDRKMNFFDVDEFCGYLFALDICKRTSIKMAEMLFTFLNIIVTLVQLFKMKDFQSNSRIKNAEKLIQKTSLVLKELENECVDKIYMAFFENSSEKNDEDLVAVYNDLITHINGHSDDPKYQLNLINHMSISEMFGGVDKKTRIRYIDQYVDVVLDFRKESDANRIFFKNYLRYLFTTKYLFETNDLIDINICYAAFTNNLKIVTTDGNLKNAYCDIVDITKI